MLYNEIESILVYTTIVNTNQLMCVHTISLLKTEMSVRFPRSKNQSRLRVQASKRAVSHDLLRQLSPPSYYLLVVVSFRCQRLGEKRS